MAADRLSDLPEDLLRRILYFAPAKEGASTAVLSRRWRFLWQTSGAVNLDSRSYDRTYGASLDNGPKHEAFLQGAMAALRAVAANGPVKRLSLHIESVNIYSISRFVFYRDDESETDHESETDTDQNLISKVMSNPAARSVEELHIAELLEDWSGASFPLLNSLLLHGCHVVFKDLQSMIHGAPHLTTVRLESINILHHWNDSASGNHGCTICGPEVTSLVLTDWSGYGLDEIDSIALDMPKLEYFRYEWFQSCQVSMKSQVWNMTQADLHFKDTMYDEDKLRVTFWHFLRNFGNTKVLKLKLDCPIDELAITDMKRLDELLDNKLLFNLERLEIEGCYNRAGNNVAGIAVANLLHCCPIVHDLWLRIKAKRREVLYNDHDIARKTKLDFDRSVENFKRLRGISGGNDDI
ncbi:hypothetical protein PR202_gn00515 [Eleusine coracana subsp. coracana]|uniref:F-box domain-containing protein n=1 Tax=Eleusine coracana subsp. coracana TaxID=191504 RepID=A0AAV5G413_ELECO|nr:hypothetical protein PR202_gn00515 [Eleusine coracana subsp. coracana]